LQTKPACAGSSIGVSIAYGLQDALQKAQQIISDGIDSRVVVEAFASGGREFTAIVLDILNPQNTGPSGPHNSQTLPVTLLPTEVELILDQTSNGVRTPGAIFSYRRKYLPTRQVNYYTPARFPPETVAAIREGAARLFKVLGLRDFARVDGWLLPADGTDTRIVFSDINLMSGMEQTSFLFQQAAEVGLGHADVLRLVLDTACGRNGVRQPSVDAGLTRSKPQVCVFPCFCSLLANLNGQPAFGANVLRLPLDTACRIKRPMVDAGVARSRPQVCMFACFSSNFAKSESVDSLWRLGHETSVGHHTEATNLDDRNWT
jgi:hypothetical protein